jgi:hypothetical protein
MCSVLKLSNSPSFEAAQPEVAQQLCPVQVMQALDALDFDDQLAGDQQIEAIRDGQMRAAEADGHGHLFLNR